VTKSSFTPLISAAGVESWKTVTVKSPATIEKSRFSRTSLKLSYGQSWFGTLSIGVECDTMMERLGDYRDLVKALPRAVLVLLLYVTGGALCYG
jgi:hypothetical protein